MELVEIRDLDGPNLFALRPVIKLEVSLQPGESLSDSCLQSIAKIIGAEVPHDPVEALISVVLELHKRLNLDAPEPEVHKMDIEGHISICFDWTHRYKARGIARAAFDVVAGVDVNSIDTHLETSIGAETDEDDSETPTWVRDAKRSILCAAITGTNGKTTTTRLLSHILRSTGKRVGWSSSSGVYIDGVQVIEGDYTGHGGARRVLIDPTIDYAVLETARGGILLRGLGYESNDIGVMLNVGPDHLGLYGVNTVETLARVKSTVVRTTSSSGKAVLNADDALVLAQREEIRAQVILISQEPESPAIVEHLESGGECVVLSSDLITQLCGDQRHPVIPVVDVPITYGGIARHMVENTLAATAAAIGLGISHEDIASALRTFQPDRDHNAGRLNVFELEDVTVVVDFAHNESGLKYLLDFARRLFPESARLSAVVGTAGDRQDSVFVGLGRIAGEMADRVLIKSNPKFLRGRSPEGTVELVVTGLREAGAEVKQDGIYTSEFDAVIGAIDSAVPGEVIVTMSVEDYAEIMDELIHRGARER